MRTRRRRAATLACAMTLATLVAACQPTGHSAGSTDPSSSPSTSPAPTSSDTAGQSSGAPTPSTSSSSSASTGANGGLSDAALGLGRQVLASSDGWASDGTGTTGGSTATAAHVSTVHNRGELIAALGGDNTTNSTNATPKIIFVDGTIEANVDSDNKPLTCANYADPDYSLSAYLTAYDPATWGKSAKPSGTLESARSRSQKNQAAQVVIQVGSNTTIVGLPGSKLVGGSLVLNKVDNVILRNLTVEDAADCFPAWDPTDGAYGGWNSEYDTVSLTGATHVWVDHSSFSDGGNPDANQPLHFGQRYQVHDGLLDITKASDLVTVSYNTFTNHDKTMLIGSTNTVGADVGHLRVTIHHCRFDNVGQRAPRVRFGQVDVYNNLFVATKKDTYIYTWGVGVQSALFAENNTVVLDDGITAAEVISAFSGTAMTERGTLVQAAGQSAQAVSLLEAYNATHDPDLASDAGWTPTLRSGQIAATSQVEELVNASAGSGHLPG